MNLCFLGSNRGWWKGVGECPLSVFQPVFDIEEDDGSALNRDDGDSQPEERQTSTLEYIFLGCCFWRPIAGRGIKLVWGNITRAPGYQLWVVTFNCGSVSAYFRPSQICGKHFRSEQASVCVFSKFLDCPLPLQVFSTSNQRGVRVRRFLLKDLGEDAEQQGEAAAAAGGSGGNTGVGPTEGTRSMDTVRKDVATRRQGMATLKFAANLLAVPLNMRTWALLAYLPEKLDEDFNQWMISLHTKEWARNLVMQLAQGFGAQVLQRTIQIFVEVDFAQKLNFVYDTRVGEQRRQDTIVATTAFRYMHSLLGSCALSSLAFEVPSPMFVLLSSPEAENCKKTFLAS